MAVIKVLLDARERSSCTSSYWDPAFPHLKFHRKSPEPLVGDPFWPKVDIQFPHLWFSTLTTGHWQLTLLTPRYASPFRSLSRLYAIDMDHFWCLSHAVMYITNIIAKPTQCFSVKECSGFGTWNNAPNYLGRSFSGFHAVFRIW